MNIMKLFAATALVGLFLSNALAGDWPQYLGPNRNSTSEETGILRSWPSGGPEVLWTVGIGIGFGGPVISDGKIYLLDRDDEAGDIFRCLDLSNGEELWRYEYAAPGSVMFPGSRSVPLVDGNRVYSCGPYGDLYSFDIHSRMPVWHKNVWTDFGGGEIPTWAITQNPLIYGELLIIASQAPGAGVVAYNKLTGDVVWSTPSLGHLGYVSPEIVRIDGEDHLVMVTASSDRGEDKGKVIGIETLTGGILWEHANWECGIPIPGAVDAGGNRILITGGYELGAMMLKVDKKADGSYSVSELFKTVEFGDQTKPPILHNGFFYGQYGTNNRRDGLVCMSMEGEIMWKTRRSPDFNKGSMILVDGLILATDGTESLYLIEPDPAGFKPLASANLLGEKSDENEAPSRSTAQNWAPIALSGGKLLIRDQNRLMCVQVGE